MLEGWIPTLLISAAAMFVLYRRARRLFTRQQLSFPRLGLRLGIIGAVFLMLFAAVSIARGIATTGAGLAVGVVVGLVAVAFTRFESVEGQVYYTPNLYIGIGMLSLLAGRLVYRLTTLDEAIDVARSNSGEALGGLQGLQSSPVASAILFVVLGYFLCYTAAVMICGALVGRAHP